MKDEHHSSICQWVSMCSVAYIAKCVKYCIVVCACRSTCSTMHINRRIYAGLGVCRCSYCNSHKYDLSFKLFYLHSGCRKQNVAQLLLKKFSLRAPHTGQHAPLSCQISILSVIFSRLDTYLFLWPQGTAIWAQHAVIFHIISRNIKVHVKDVNLGTAFKVWCLLKLLLKPFIQSAHSPCKI